MKLSKKSGNRKFLIRWKGEEDWESEDLDCSQFNLNEKFMKKLYPDVSGHFFKLYLLLGPKNLENIFEIIFQFISFLFITGNNFEDCLLQSAHWRISGDI